MKRKGLRTYQISYVEKQNKSFFRHSPRSPSNSPEKTLPSIPRSLIASPRLEDKEEEEEEESTKSIQRFQSMPDSPTKQQDGSLLKELYDVMADIQETDSESDRKFEEEDDVFMKQQAFSPNIISTPFRYSQYLVLLSFYSLLAKL